MRTLSMLFVLFVLALTGWAAGYVAYAPPAPTPIPPTPTATITEGRLDAAGFVVVDRTMFDVLMRATDQRDPRPFALALDTGDVLSLAPGTRVRVLKRDGRVAQFEILDGKYAGRAGWQYASALTP